MTEHPLFQLTLCRFREFIREPGAVFWVFAFPILISLALGLAFRNQGPVRIAVAVVEGAQAGAAVVTIEKGGVLSANVLPEAEARQALRSGRVALVAFPGREARFLVDQSQPNSPLVLAAARDALERGAGRVDVLDLKTESVRGAGSRYIDFLVPGIIGMAVMSSSIWGIGWSLVQLRTRRLLKRLVATPMSRAHLLLSYLVFRLALAVVEVGALVAFGALVFGTEVRGSYGALAFVLLVGALAFAGLALLVASRAENAETAGGLMNLATMPMFVFSGVFFSSDKFPSWMQPVIQALPLTALNGALRGVMNDGMTLSRIAVPLAILGVWCVGCFALSLRIFRWV